MGKTIKTYSTETFREAYIPPVQKLDEVLKEDFGKFFVIPVEQMIRLIQLPVPPIRSTTHTFIYLTEGYATMNIGSETYTIYAHECLSVPAGQVFSFASVDINKGYLCNFHTDFLIGKFGRKDLINEFEFLQVWGNPRITLTEETSGFVRNLFQRLLIEYSQHGLTHTDILQPYFMALLCEVNRAYRPLSTSTRVQAVQFTNRFKELLFTHLKTKHRVTDYAELLHITPNHLNKTVKAITGKSPTRWIDEAIILEAKVLLHQSTLSIHEVALEVGFEDASYFSRLFKRYEGMTPLDFRHRIEMS